ncbi:MAG: HPr family phosphocarrier protein [Leptospiraceae bacterium]|nr:HPr family phosphocarrier protein [Leptospiraceae bacterium]MCP5511712.1 HPr family phosphocarrier protein [Leptospiraceae bacterium]
MKKVELKISEEGEGMHARPASVFVQTASKFPCEVKVIKDGIEVNGKSIMGLMMLALAPGSIFSLIVDGEKEDEALEKLSSLIEKNFK